MYYGNPGYGTTYGYGAGYGTGYEACCTTGYGNGLNGYALILVLFILLVIIGCTCYNFH